MKLVYTVVAYDGGQSPDNELLRMLIYQPEHGKRWTAVVKSKRCDLPDFTSMGTSLTEVMRCALKTFYKAAQVANDEETGS